MMKKGAITFLDILGFKGIWQRKPVEAVLTILNEIPILVSKSHQRCLSENKGYGSSEPQIRILSDTIVITIDSEDPNCLFKLATIIHEITFHFHQNEMFIPGAIGYGEYCHSVNTFLGPGIDDVAAWYEVADWIGVISTPKTNYILDLYFNVTLGVNNFDICPFIKYEVPGKNDIKYNLNCINWPGYLQAASKKMPNLDQKSETRALIEDLFSKQAAFDGSVLRKYENTLNFIDYAVKFIKLKTNTAKGNSA